MAPRTRQAQRVAKNHAEGGSNGSHDASEHGRSPNIFDTGEVAIVGQGGIDKVNPRANLKGGFKTLALGIANIMKTRSQRETHLIHP
jgi:hypothetical protein